MFLRLYKFIILASRSNFIQDRTNFFVRLISNLWSLLRVLRPLPARQARAEVDDGRRALSGEGAA